MAAGLRRAAELDQRARQAEVGVVVGGRDVCDAAEELGGLGEAADLEVGAGERLDD
jgi:hypothetical protein